MLLTIILVILAFGGGYLVGANNPLSSVKKKIQDEAKGLLKKLPFILLPILLFTSCAKYTDTITGTVVQTGDACAFRPTDSLTLDSAAKGWISIEQTAGNPLICRIDVKTEASWSQKKDIADHKGGAVLTYVLWVIAGLLVVVGIIAGNRGAGIVVVVGSFVLAIALAAGGAARIDWAITKEFSMPKAVYDNPDARHAFEDANIYL